MSLRRTALILIALTIGISIAIMFLYSRFFLLDSFHNLEDNLTARNLQRVNEAIGSKFNELNRMAGDYATWDDTYKFIVDHNPAYIKSNLVDNTFSNLKINLMIFMDNSGRIVQANYFDLGRLEQLPFPASLKERWAAVFPLLSQKKIDSSTTGFLVLPEGILMLAARPIITSKSEGPVRGAVIFGRFLDQLEIDRLKEQTKVVFDVKRTADPALPEDFRRALSMLNNGKKGYVETPDSNHNLGYQMSRDLFGKPAVIFRVKDVRDFYQQGLTLVNNYSIFFVVVGLALIVVIMFLLERMVLIRVFQIGSEVNAIAKSGNLAKRVEFSGRDELGVLAGRINDMLDALNASRLQLNESEHKFKQLFDATPEAIFLEDIDGRIIDCNQSALRMTGYSREELLKLRSFDLVSAETAKTFGTLIAQVQSLGSYQAEAEGKRKNGEIFLQEVTVRSIEIEHKKLFLVVVRDISERKVLDHKLNERVEELEQFHDTVIGRELKMMDLEKEIDALLAELGRKPKYNRG